MPNFIRGCVHDGSRLLGRTACGRYRLDVHNAANRHANLEADYHAARKAGARVQRFSVWLADLCVGAVPQFYSWDRLDRLAKLSQKHQDIQLVISHYEFHPYALEGALHSGLNARLMDNVGEAIAKRYPGVFHSYVPAAEMGFWAGQIARENPPWWPHLHGPDWWPGFQLIANQALATAAGLKRGDPTCKLATSEPWMEHLSVQDNARPHSTLLGWPDEVADREGMQSWLYGADSFVDIVGINVYQPYFMADAVAQAKVHFPGKEIWLAEMGNIAYPDKAPAEIWGLAEESRASVALWAPAGHMRAFGQGEWVGAPLEAVF